MAEIKPTTSHGTNASIEDAKAAGKVSDMAEANAGTQTEHDLTIKDALKLYPKAILFSFIFSTSIIMEGYDMSLIGNFYGFTPFKMAYGDQIDPKTGIPVVSAPWQAGVKNSMMVGCILGLYLNGILTEKFGYKKTLSGSLIFLLGFIFIPFFATNIETILVGLTLSGVCWGIFQALSVTYASEVAPTVLRPFLTTYVNLCWVLGQLTALGVLRGFITNTTQWAYRVPFAIQWFWPVPILIGCYFAPESPWWLVRQERYEDARAALLKLVNTGCGVPYDVDNQLAMIKATNDFEKKVSSGASYLDCFRGTDLRRTEITCISWLIQSQCGSALMSFSVQFFTSAGLAETNSFNFSLGQYGMGAVGTFMSWFLMTKMGRRSIIIWGLVALIVCLLTAGGMGFSSNPNIGMGVGSVLIIYTFIYDFTVGPLVYTVVAETPSTRLKSKTVSLARNVYNCGQIVNNILMPRMVLSVSWNWGARTALYWAGLATLLLVWCYFRLPECKDRTYGELDILFENKVSARKFASTSVDQFASHETGFATGTDGPGREKGGARARTQEVEDV